MSIDPEILRNNAEWLARLEKLVASDPDYGVDLGGGWTAAVAFAHMAFWDRRASLLMQTWNVGDPLPVSNIDDLLNPILESFWQQLKPEVTGQMAVDAAREVNAVIESLADDVAEALDAGGFGFTIRRGVHREDHINQIEREI